MSSTTPMPNYSLFENVESWTGENFLENRGLWSDYVWIVIFGSLVAFLVAWGIGANDVANSFATSVGSKSISMAQAVIIAGIFEFVGAVALGGSVTGTVKKGITSPAIFVEVPEIFAYGCLCALVSSWIWLTVATYVGLGVSTTHSMVGAMLGFGLTYGGDDGVTWNKRTDEFPFRKGFTPVVMAWFIAPVFTAIISSNLFFWTRLFVMRRENAYTRAFWAFPPLAGVTFFIVLLSIMLKGIDEDMLPWDSDKKAWVSVIVGAGVSVLSIPYVLYFRKQLLKKDEEAEVAQQEAEAERAHVEAGGAPKDKTAEIFAEEEAQKNSLFGRFMNSPVGQSWLVQYFYGSLNKDVHAHAEAEDANEKVKYIHSNAEVFDPRAENVFKKIQVLTACAVAFVHGANDVANAVGPLAGIWETYNSYRAADKASQPRWILVIGALGIVLGLATWGYRMIIVLGVDLIHITPCRGYCAELAAAAIIALASTYGLPVSTTQVITGGEVGIGLVEDWRGRAVNWKLFAKTFTGWVFTLVIAAFLSSMFFSMGAYSPCRTNLDYVVNYQWAMNKTLHYELDALNQTIVMVNQTTGRYDAVLDEWVKGLRLNLTNLMDYKTNGHVNQYNMIYLQEQINGLFQRHVIPAVGYNVDAPASEVYRETEMIVPAQDFLIQKEVQEL